MVISALPEMTAGARAVSPERRRPSWRRGGRAAMTCCGASRATLSAMASMRCSCRHRCWRSCRRSLRRRCSCRFQGKRSCWRSSPPRPSSPRRPEVGRAGAGRGFIIGSGRGSCMVSRCLPKTQGVETDRPPGVLRGTTTMGVETTFPLPALKAEGMSETLALPIPESHINELIRGGGSGRCMSHGRRHGGRPPGVLRAQQLWAMLRTWTVPH